MPPNHLPLFPDTRRRWVGEEQMDLPGADDEKLRRTVRQFPLLNGLFTSYRKILRRHLFGAIRRSGEEREWRVLDLGSGGGDILRWVKGEALRRGIKIRLLGADPDPRMVQWAAEDHPGIEFVTASSADLPALSAEYGPFDFLLSNHVMHHLSPEALLSFIRSAAEHARVGVVLNDLERSRVAYLFYRLFAGIFTPDSFALEDGLLSILKGFRKKELEEFVSVVGKTGELVVRSVFPSRLVIVSKDS